MVPLSGQYHSIVISVVSHSKELERTQISSHKRMEKSSHVEHTAAVKRNEADPPDGLDMARSPRHILLSEKKQLS